MSRHTTFQPISVRHTSLWQCRTPLTHAPTNQRSPHAALATPYSANFRSNQSAFATRRSGNAELRHLCSHQPARATRRICHAARYPFIRRRVPPYQISCSSPFVALVSSKSTQVVIPSRILASVTSTRLISVTDHRAFRVAARVPAPGAPRAPRYPFAPQDQPCDARVLPLPRVHPLPRALPHLRRTSPSPPRAALAVASEHRSAYPGLVPQGTKHFLRQGTGPTRGVGSRDSPLCQSPSRRCAG